jgi:predicted phage-related endonuclease
MTMKYLDVEQGSPEWLEARKRHFCASDAAAMLGLSKNKTRAALLSMMASGTEKEFSAWEQEHLLEKGKKAEAYWRPIADKIIGKSLYPSVGVDVVEGLPLLASFDGITMSGRKTWEHKARSKYLIEFITEQTKRFSPLATRTRSSSLPQGSLPLSRMTGRCSIGRALSAASA